MGGFILCLVYNLPEKQQECYYFSLLYLNSSKATSYSRLHLEVFVGSFSARLGIDFVFLKQGVELFSYNMKTGAVVQHCTALHRLHFWKLALLHVWKGDRNVPCLCSKETQSFLFALNGNAEYLRIFSCPKCSFYMS